MTIPSNKNEFSLKMDILNRFKRRHRTAWREIKEKYGGLIWVLPGTVCVHELSHIIVGMGLNMRYGWYGFTMNREMPEALFGSIGVYVNDVTPWTFAAGLIGSLLWIFAMRRYGPLFGLRMTKQIFWAGLLYALWIAKFDLRALAG